MQLTGEYAVRFNSELGHRQNLKNRQLNRTQIRAPGQSGTSAASLVTNLPHQSRVFQEQLELNQKIERLETFLTTELFMQLDEEDQSLLSQQLDIMMSYNDILKRRIERF